MRNAVARNTLIACLAALCPACGYRHGDLALDGALRIELSPPTGPHFYGIFVERRADGVDVSGFGRRPVAQGHVDITILGPDGIALARVATTPLPPRAGPHRGYNYRFRASLPVIPPAGSTLRVAYEHGADAAHPASGRLATPGTPMPPEAMAWARTWWR